MKYSFEFFPPRTQQAQIAFWQAVYEVATVEPEFFSMTYGALGSDHQESWDMLCRLQEAQPDIAIAAHLTSAGHNRNSLLEYAQQLAGQGIKRLVVLRGDAEILPDGFHSVPEMISALQKITDFDISVAAYPEVHPRALSAAADLAVLKAKLDAGAKRAITQYFFTAESFLRFRDQAMNQGIKQPIIPGILPIHDFTKICDFSTRCGAQVPKVLKQQFTAQMSLSEQQKVGMDWTVALCQDLQREGVEQFHIYTLNQPGLSWELVSQLDANQAIASPILEAA